MEIEHKGSQNFPDGTSSGCIERDDLMSSVALWYQTEPHKKWPALPAGKDRLPSHDDVFVKGWATVETASQAAKNDSAADAPAAKTHPLSIQPLAIDGIPDSKQLFFQPTDATGKLELTFTLDAPRTVNLLGRLVNSWDYGKYRILLDGQELAVLDLFNPNVVVNTYRWGTRNLDAGKHTLRFECVGKADASKGYFLGFCSLVDQTCVYARDPSVDLRTLQKK